MDDNETPDIQNGPILTRDEVADKLHLTPRHRRPAHRSHRHGHLPLPSHIYL